nr:head-tail connector protein [uncultured Acinetobacter sp.]
MSDYNITLVKMKHYLSVRHNRDDVFIESLIKVALADVQNSIDRTFEDVGLLADGSIQPPLEAAVNMVVDDLYHNRSTQFEKALFDNKVFIRLLSPYRKMGV